MCLSRLGSLSLEGDNLLLYLLRTGVGTYAGLKQVEITKAIKQFYPHHKAEKVNIVVYFHDNKNEMFFLCFAVVLIIFAVIRTRREDTKPITQFVFSVFTTVSFHFLLHAYVSLTAYFPLCQQIFLYRTIYSVLPYNAMCWINLNILWFNSRQWFLVVRLMC